MFKAVKIEISPEGAPSETHSPVEVITFAEAKLAETALEEGAYDKTNFTVYYENGETYKGRYDLKREDTEKADLAKYIREDWEFYAGLSKPEDLEQSKYETILSVVGEKVMAYCAQYLQDYQVGDL